MQSPAAMFIESAMDSLTRTETNGGVPCWIRESQQKELSSAAGAEVSDDFRNGYELGLQTARMMIKGNMALQLKGVNADEVL